MECPITFGPDPARQPAWLGGNGTVTVQQEVLCVRGKVSYFYFPRLILVLIPCFLLLQEIIQLVQELRPVAWLDAVSSIIFGLLLPVVVILAIIGIPRTLTFRRDAMTLADLSRQYLTLLVQAAGRPRYLMLQLPSPSDAQHLAEAIRTPGAVATSLPIVFGELSSSTTTCGFDGPGTARVDDSILTLSGRRSTAGLNLALLIGLFLVVSALAVALWLLSDNSRFASTAALIVMILLSLVYPAFIPHRTLTLAKTDLVEVLRQGREISFNLTQPNGTLRLFRCYAPTVEQAVALERVLQPAR